MLILLYIHLCLFNRQFDMRAPHTCTGDVNNMLVYLRTHLGRYAEAKCLAINPCRPELLAVGANDPYVRIYDRRMIKLTGAKVCTFAILSLICSKYFVAYFK